MSRFLLLLIIGCTAVATPRAQAQAAPIYYLDLSQQTLALPDRAVQVEQVVDGRVGQPAIGLVYRGLQNRQAPVLFQRGLETELTAWLRQQLPARPTDHAVVLCVRQLLVGEVLNGLSERASADLTADVYARLPDGYHFVRSVASHTSTRALETTLYHAPHVATLLQQCLAQLAEVDWNQAARRPARTLAQLAADKPLAVARPAIVRAASPRRGVYFSFAQFLANRPDTVTELRLITHRTLNPGWEGTTLCEASLRNADGRVPKREVWGVSDGRQAYVRQRGNYRPLNPQADFFTFVGAAPRDVAAMNRRAENYALWGPVGAAMTNNRNDTTGKPTVYALNMYTGETTLYPPPGQIPRPDTAFIYVYRPLGGASAPCRLLLNDHEVAQLRPGEYQELAWPHFAHVVRLAVGTAGGAALLLVPNAAAANYIKLGDDPVATPWQWMPRRQGEAEVDALDRLRK